MRPSDSTTGVKSDLHRRAEIESLSGHGVVVQPLTVGYGKLPPARKCADSPEIAVRVGSASVRITPACSIACKLAVTLLLNVPVIPVGEFGIRLDCPLGPKGLAVLSCPLTGKGLSLLKLTVEVPRLRQPLRLMPSCFITVRSISAIVTFSMTWSRPRTTIALTILLALAPFRRGAYPAAAGGPECRAPAAAGGSSCTAAAVAEGRTRIDEMRCDVVGLLRLQLVRHGAGQNDAIADASNFDEVITLYVASWTEEIQDCLFDDAHITVRDLRP